MSLSRGALRCLEQLKYYARQSGRAFPFQDTLARDLKRDSRTVRRYLFELVQTGHLQVIKRQHSSAEYVLSDVQSNVRSGDSILTEAKTLNLKEPAKKPMDVQEPEPYITLESGRQVINPAWQRVRDRIRAAHQDGRLHAARDREAYIAAIIRGETRAS